MGFYHDQLFLTTSRGRCETSLTTEPKAHGPPPLGGGRYSRERLAGESGWSTLVFPCSDPPRSGLPRKLGEYYFPESCCILVICTDFADFSDSYYYLLLHDYFVSQKKSPCMWKIHMEDYRNKVVNS